MFKTYSNLKQSVAVCCSICTRLVLQRVSCSVLQCVRISTPIPPRCVAVCCSVLQCVAVCCSVLQCAVVCASAICCGVFCCSLLQHVATSVLSAPPQPRGSATRPASCCSMPQSTHVQCVAVRGVAASCRKCTISAPQQHYPRDSAAMHALCCSMWCSACCSKGMRSAPQHQYAISPRTLASLCCSMSCCSMLQHVAACCSMLQHVAACCSMLQHVAACCSMLQHAAARCITLGQWSISSRHIQKSVM